MNRFLRLAAAAAAVAVAVAACGSGDGSSDAAAPATPVGVTSPASPSPSAGDDSGGDDAPTAAITIKDFRYGAPLTVAARAQVTVTNEDTAGHDVVSDDAGKFRTPTLAKGEKAVFTAPAEPGTYKFSCSLHANMTGIGTLIVTG